MASGKKMVPGGPAVVLAAAALLFAAAAAMAAAEQASNVRAYWSDYHPESINWDLNAAKVACARLDADRPLSWRSKYAWTAFCGPVGPFGDAACGQCLNVTNRATGQSVTVRVVDVCTSPALDLDRDTAFIKIDADGNGILEGHLTVDYEFVNCGDDDDVTDGSISSM